MHSGPTSAPKGKGAVTVQVQLQFVLTELPNISPLLNQGPISLLLFPCSFFTTRVNIQDENFLASPFFKSARPTSSLNVDQKIGFGAGGAFLNLLDKFPTFWQFLIFGNCYIFESFSPEGRRTAHLEGIGRPHRIVVLTG